MVRFLLLVVLLIGAPACVQVEAPPGLPVAKTDPLYAHLAKWQAEMTPDGASVVERHFSEWRELQSDAARKLLPQYRVFAIAWHDQSEAQDISVPFGGSVTLALRRDGSEFSELRHTGNYEEYGRLLVKNGVLLRNSEDGKLIWDGFCDLHLMQWKKHKIERKDAQTWHLGVITIDGRRYYYEVKLNASLKVVSARSRSEAVASEEPLSSDRDHAMGIRSR